MMDRRRLPQTEVITKKKEELEPLYRVIIHAVPGHHPQ
jgi:hypothetical protein